jgi:hypothetical protein
VNEAWEILRNDLSAPPTEAEKRAQCEWVLDDIDGKWDTGCGEAFFFEVDGPAENGMRYCPYCGKRLVVAPVGGGPAQEGEDVSTL